MTARPRVLLVAHPQAARAVRPHLAAALPQADLVETSQAPRNGARVPGLTSLAVAAARSPAEAAFQWRELREALPGTPTIAVCVGDEAADPSDRPAPSPEEPVVPLEELPAALARAARTLGLPEQAGEGERRFQEFFQSAPIGLFRRTLEGRLLAVNPALTEILGYPSCEALLATPVEDLYWDPADRVAFEGEIGRTGSVHNREVRLRRLDGSQARVLVNTRAVRDPGGNLLHLEGSLQDLTALREAEALARDRELDLRTLLESGQTVVWRVPLGDGSPDGPVVFANSAAREVLGYPAEAYRRDPDLWRRQIHPEDLPRALRATRELVRTGGAVTRLYRVRHGATGEDRWIEDRVTARMGPEGRVMELFGVAWDVTRRQRAERALRESEERFRVLAAATTEAVVVHDGERILECNGAACDLFGYSRGELLGLDPLTLAAPDYRRRVRTFVAGGRSTTYEAPGVRRDGTRFWAEVRARTIQYRGSPARVALVRDVTAEREHQRQRRVQDRMAAVGQLAAGIAHDFNNLLLAITGYAELLKDEPHLSEKARSRLDELVGLGFRAADLVRQILDFSRTDGTEKHPLNLISLVKETAKLLERTLPDPMEVRLDLPADEAYVLGNPAEVQQILVNLAINGAHAMPEGGTLEIGAALREVPAGPDPHPRGLAPGRWVELTVADSGCGIPPEHLDRIFEPFFTTKGKGRGTGLGLAQVYGLVRQHGGVVTVESAVGAGSVFRVWLPAAERTAPTGSADPAPRPGGGGRRILVVDDDPTVREIAAALVEGLGYRALQAASGKEALELLDGGGPPPDLVLSDVSMPDLHGIALADRLARRNPPVPVVLMSGYAPPEALPQGVAFVAKPVNRAHLARALAAALGDASP
ncbi:MAG: hypothetical protein Kow0092_16370 [Deferrisomatales bacterium]